MKKAIFILISFVFIFTGYMLVKNDGASGEYSPTFDLSGKGLKTVPTEIFSRNDLKELDLSHNQISGSLTSEINKLKNLEVLDISSNQMTGVPAEIGQLSNLKILDLSFNLISGLPHELGNLKNLKELYINGNDYSEYDLEIIKQGLPTNVNIIK